jgi:hypothetical protein
LLLGDSRERADDEKAGGPGQTGNCSGKTRRRCSKARHIIGGEAGCSDHEPSNRKHAHRESIEHADG